MFRYLFKTMSVLEKFKKDINIIKSAVNSECYLDLKNVKLYKKLLRFYRNQGIVFSNDALDTYEILMNCLAEDIEKSEINA